MKKPYLPDMIEVSVKTNSPWKGVFQDAMRDYLERWGWTISCFQDGDELIFVGIERVK